MLYLQGVGNFVNTGVLLILLAAFQVAKISEQALYPERLAVSRQCQYIFIDMPTHVMKSCVNQFHCFYISITSCFKLYRYTQCILILILLHCLQSVWRTAFGVGMAPIIAILFYRVIYLQVSLHSNHPPGTVSLFDPTTNTINTEEQFCQKPVQKHFTASLKSI